MEICVKLHSEYVYSYVRIQNTVKKKKRVLMKHLKSLKKIPLIINKSV